MYQALYRKWRPRSFDDVVGQEHVTETLKRQIESGRLSHAYLFVGSRGTGKTTCAKILARAANCENPVGGNPCGKCASCLGIESGAVLDIEEMDAASNNGVDNIRALREEAVYTPASVRKRVYIVDEVHMLSTGAFNALLKILEEPPEHLIFILATTEIHKVPATILSRCQRFSFKRITASDIAGRLLNVAKDEDIQLDDDAARLLARLAGGSMRDGLSLLDQCAGAHIDTARVIAAVGLSGAMETVKLLSAIAEGKTEAALTFFSDLYFNGKDVDAVLKELSALCRDILMTNVAPRGGEGLLSGNFDTEILKDFSRKIPAQKVLAFVKRIQTALDVMPISADCKTVAELCLIELCDSKLSTDTDMLSARIAELEKALQSGKFTVQEPVEEAESWPMFEMEENPEPIEEMGFPLEEAPIPETIHEPTPAPEPKAEVPVLGGNEWDTILKIIQNKIDMPAYTFLNDKSHVAIKIGGGTLEIQTKSPIAKSLIDTVPVTTALKETAEAVMKTPVRVLISEYSGEEQLNQDKLDALKRFNNIKFE